MVLSIPLFASCLKTLCLDCWSTETENYVRFDNYDNYDIESVGVSLYRDSLSYPYRIFLVNDNVFSSGKRATGVEILRGVERYYANENNYSHRGEHFLLFMDQDKNILLVWDLRDTTQRWADESLWTMDSTYKEVPCCSGIKMTYYNTYTFSDEDFAAQQ